jgi:arylsulfatase A-like enzyme
LAQLGIRDKTIVTVTADHGEEFWEHRDEEMAAFADPRDVFGTGHGHHLFQVHLLVPLVIFGPGIPAAAITGNTSLVDVMPTVLAAVGQNLDRLDGRSLLEPLPPDRPVFAEAIAYGFEKRTVIEGDRKLLSAPGDGIERLYDLGPDRREVRVVSDRADAERLRGLLPGEASSPGEQTVATEEILEHLRALGYLD